MATVAGAVITEIKGLLNDPTGSIYPDVALIPLLNKAYRELQVKLNALGIKVTYEVTNMVTLNIGADRLEDGSGLPVDLIWPVQVAERDEGSDKSFTPMEERDWDPDLKPESTLRYWVWREEALRFVGATTIRQILIRYVKALVPISDLVTPIQINDSQTWLAQRTAALAALLIGQNQSRANALMVDLTNSGGPWEDLKATKVKRLQAIPVRRRRTRYRVP